MPGTLRRQIRKFEERIGKLDSKISRREVRRDLLARQSRSYSPDSREYASIAREHDKLNLDIIDLKKDRDDMQDDLDYLNRSRPHHYDRYEGHEHRDMYSYEDVSDSQEWTGYRN